MRLWKSSWWACPCAVCRDHNPLVALLCSNSGKGSLVVDFSPAGVSYPDDEFLRHARVTWKPDVNIFQAVCVGLVYARQLCLRGKWKWSEIGLQPGAGEARSPSSSQSRCFCRGAEGARWAHHCGSAHLHPPPAQMQHLFPSTSPAQAGHDGAELSE